MLKRMFVGNIEECRLEAEVSNDSDEVVAIIYEDNAGWHVEEEKGFSGKLSNGFVEETKAEMRRFVNRMGMDAPEECTKGELSLWLLLKDDGTAMGFPY